MSKYSNFEKEKLGKTFQYYRKKFDIKWDVIIKESKISKNKYTKMSRGILLSKEKYYDEYLRLFKLNFISTELLENWLNKNLSKLTHALEYYEYEEISRLYFEFEKLIEHKAFPIYEQYYICLEHIFKYYFHNKFLNEREIEMDLILLKAVFFEESLAIFLLEVMYISNNNSIGSDSIRRKIIEIIEKYDSLILDHSIALNEKCEKKMNHALEKFKELYVIWDKKNNDYRKTKALNGMFMIYQNIDIEKSLEIIPKLIDCRESNGIPKSLKKSLNFNIGMFYYMNQKFEESYSLFMENVERFNSKKELVFIGSICTHLSKNLPDCFLEVNNLNSPYRVFIEYFRMKKKEQDSVDLVYYIMNTVLKEQLIYDEYLQPMWSMFEYEMLDLLKKNKKNYNDYLKFREIQDKICKFR